MGGRVDFLLDITCFVEADPGLSTIFLTASVIDSSCGILTGPEESIADIDIIDAVAFYLLVRSELRRDRLSSYRELPRWLELYSRFNYCK